MKLRLSAICIIGFGVGCQTVVNPDPTHMLRLVCEGTEESDLQSRLAVLKTSNSDYDYGFATGHAVPAERPCAVKDFEGRSRPVDFIQLADNYQAGESTDWAIIRFKRISTKGLVRYALEPVEDLGDFEAGFFSFAQARGLSENAQSCRLSVLDFQNGRTRVTHDCRAVPGQSGSPITRKVGGETKLVGLHIGHLWMLESPETGRPDRKGYINLLNQDILDEISAIIDADNR